MNWSLDASIHYLNHGAFGACPEEIMQHYREWQNRLELSPLRFILRELDPLIDESRAALAAFTGAEPDGLVLVPNATHGVNTVLKSIPFKPGDEVLITNHIYNACRNTLFHLRQSAAITVREVVVPFPGTTPEAVYDAVVEAITPATRLVMLDHITSPTALRFPVEAIVAELNRRGIESLIDGAHAPGSIPLNISAIAPTYYTGNCHKWMCLPKQCAFLWVDAAHRQQMVPLAISHAWGPDVSFARRFHWQGTSDLSAALCIPHAINLIRSQMPGGWDEWMEHNRQLALLGRQILCQTLEIPSPCPPEMIASMAAVPLPLAPRPVVLGYNTTDQLQEDLWANHAIEVPVFQWPDARHLLLRIAAQNYNTQEQWHLLASALSHHLHH